MNLLLTNVTIVTNDSENLVLDDHAVAVAGSRIVDVAPVAELLERYDNFDLLDGGGRLLMPGLVNAHMHFYGTFARGLALPRQPENFAQILAWLWWTLDKALDLDGVYYSALLPAIVGVRKGVTTVIDHHASPNAVAGSLDKIEEALRTVGMRGLLCYEVSDRDGPAIREAGLAENARYIEKCSEARDRDPDYLYDGMMGLHASFTLENETLAAAAAIAERLERGHHIHVLEGTLDEEETQRQFGVGVAERLHEFGIFGPKSLAAHGIYLDEHGMDLVAETDTMVAHNPQSNMNNAVGRADIFGLLERDIRVGIGTDGMTADLKVDVRTGHLLHKHHLSDPTLGWNEFQEMTLRNNPAIYERLTGQKIGRIEAGYLADLILVDYFPPTPLDGSNFWGHFLFGIADAPVDTTMINGEIVMRHKVIPGVDEAQIARESRHVAKAVWQRFHELSE